MQRRHSQRATKHQRASAWLQAKTEPQLRARAGGCSPVVWRIQLLRGDKARSFDAYRAAISSQKETVHPFNTAVCNFLARRQTGVAKIKCLKCAWASELMKRGMGVCATCKASKPRQFNTATALADSSITKGPANSYGSREHLFALCPGAGLRAAHMQQRAHSLPQCPLASSAVAVSSGPYGGQQRRLQRLAQPIRKQHLHSRM